MTETQEILRDATVPRQIGEFGLSEKDSGRIQYIRGDPSAENDVIQLRDDGEDGYQLAIWICDGAEITNIGDHVPDRFGAEENAQTVADRLVRTVRRHALCRSVEGQERTDAMEEALNKTDMTVRESMTVTCVLRDKYDGTVRVEAHEGTFEVDV
jgi:hypothetical protein